MPASSTLIRDAISTNASQRVAPNPGLAHEGNIIQFQKLQGETAENIESTKLLPRLLRSDNLPGAIMTDPTREEIDAKLTNVELRTENRFNELSSKIDRVVDAIGTLTSAVTTLRAEVKEARIEVKEEGKFTRWTVALTLIASLIAFAGALWVTQGNILSAFQAGLLLKSEQAPPSAPRPLSIP
jgi:hypothetical protein